MSLPRNPGTVVATGDLTVGTDLVRSMAQRAGVRIVALEGPHGIMPTRAAP